MLPRAGSRRGRRRRRLRACSGSGGWDQGQPRRRQWARGRTENQGCPGKDLWLEEAAFSSTRPVPPKGGRKSPSRRHLLCKYGRSEKRRGNARCGEYRARPFPRTGAGGKPSNHSVQATYGPSRAVEIDARCQALAGGLPSSGVPGAGVLDVRGGLRPGVRSAGTGCRGPLGRLRGRGREAGEDKYDRQGQNNSMVHPMSFLLQVT